MGGALLGDVECRPDFRGGQAVRLVSQQVQQALLAGAQHGFLRAGLRGELLDALQQDDRVPLERLAGLLTETDGIKFARRDVSPVRGSKVPKTQTLPRPP